MRGRSSRGAGILEEDRLATGQETPGSAACVGYAYRQGISFVSTEKAVTISLAFAVMCVRRYS